MNCHNCQKEMREGSKYCISCGASILLDTAQTNTGAAQTSSTPIATAPNFLGPTPTPIATAPNFSSPTPTPQIEVPTPGTPTPLSAAPAGTYYATTPPAIAPASPTTNPMVPPPTAAPFGVVTDVSSFSNTPFSNDGPSPSASGFTAEPFSGNAAPLALDNGAKKRKTKLALVFCILGLLLVGIVLFLIFGGQSSPKSKVSQAIANTSAAIVKEQNAFKDYVGFAQVFENLSTLPTFSSFNTEFSNSYGDDYVSFTYTGQRDAEEKKQLGTLSLEMNYTQTDIEYLIDDNILAVFLEEFLDKGLAVKADTFGIDFNNSVLSDMIGQLLDESLGINFFPQSPGKTPPKEDYASLLSNIPMSKETLAAITQLGKTLSDKTTATLIGTENVDINGINKTCDIYRYNIKTEDLVAILDKFSAKLLNDKEFTDYIISLLESLQTFSDAGLAIYDVDDLRNSTNKLIDNIEFLLAKDGFSIDYYLHNEYLLMVQALITNKFDEKSTLSLEIGGAQRMSDSFTIRLLEPYEDEIVFSSIGHFPTNGDAVYTDILLAQGNEKMLQIVFNWDVDDNKDNFEVVLSVNDADGEQVLFSDFAGTVWVSPKDSIIDLIFQDLEIFVPYYDDKPFTLNLDWTIEPGKTPNLSSYEYDFLLDYSLDDWQELYFSLVQSSLF